MRSRAASIISVRQVEFKLKCQLEQPKQIYFNLKRQKYGDVEVMPMELETQKDRIYIYKIIINVEPKNQYEYQYSIENQYENDFRGFEYSYEDPLNVDEWNKQWCKYKFTFGDDKMFLEGYNAHIRDLGNQNMIKLERTPNNNSMIGLELVDLNKDQKNRQLCFTQKNLKGEEENLGEFLQIINLAKAKVDKINSNFIFVEFKEIDGRAKQRMNSYSNLFQNCKQLEFKNKELQSNITHSESVASEQKTQQLKNFYEKKILEQDQTYSLKILEEQKKFYIEQELLIQQNQKQLEYQQKKLEEDFENFKNHSAQIIQRYIDENEQAHQKIREYEFQKVNFSSEGIIIQADDLNQMSREEQDNLRTLQENLKKYEDNVKQMKEEEQQKYEQFDEKRNKYKRKSLILKQSREESMEQLKKCQRELQRCMESLNTSNQEYEFSRQGSNQRQMKYQQALSDVKIKLNYQEKDLHQYIIKVKELEEKYHQEINLNQNQKREFDKSLIEFQEKQNKQIIELRLQNKEILEQNSYSNQRKIDDANKESQKNQIQLIDLETKYQFEKIEYELNSLKEFQPFDGKGTTQQLFQENIQKLRELLGDITVNLNKLQENRQQFLKDLGIETIQKIDYFNLNNIEELENDNILMKFEQICKLQALLKQIISNKQYLSQYSEDNQQIQYFENIQPQLNQYVQIIKRIKQSLKYDNDRRIKYDQGNLKVALKENYLYLFEIIVGCLILFGNLP